MTASEAAPHQLPARRPYARPPRTGSEGRPQRREVHHAQAQPAQPQGPAARLPAELHLELRLTHPAPAP